VDLMVASVISLEQWLHEALEKSCQRSLLLGKWGLDCQAWSSVLQQTAALYTQEHGDCLHLAACFGMLHHYIVCAYACHRGPSACAHLRLPLRCRTFAPHSLVAASHGIPPSVLCSHESSSLARVLVWEQRAGL
jgi:hypothetical protein